MRPPRGLSRSRLPATYVSIAPRRIRVDRPLGDLALAVPGLPRMFHGLPSFAVPCKRFVTDVICDHSKNFLGSDQSYRQTVRWHGREIVHDDRQDEALARQAAALAHSTVWRWLSWLGDALPEAWRTVRQLIRARTSDSALHREGWHVSRYKYRSEPRRQTLQRAVERWVVAQVFQRLFGKAVFPRFATVARRP